MCFLCLLWLLPSCGPTPPSQETAEVVRVLDDWHDAASKSDEERYFGHFAKDAVFFGTDATERWDMPAFRAYAHPYFSQGKGWSFHAARRDITLGAAGVAWFDEALETKNLGPARGSGVLLKGADGQWKIAQYNLSVTIPNERFADVKKLLETRLTEVLALSLRERAARRRSASPKGRSIKKRRAGEGSNG
jgi:ketosteroid isomerase-like protein